MNDLVGMMGGVSGFYLASSRGIAKQFTGDYGSGFLNFAILALRAVVGLTGVKRRWRATWSGAVAGAARI